MRTPTQIAADLQHAVQAGQFHRARSLAVEYAQAVVETCGKLPASAPERIRLLREAQRFWESVRRIALSERAHLALELTSIQQASHYRKAPTCQRHVLNIEG